MCVCVSEGVWHCILLRIQFTQLDVVENKDGALFEENVGGVFWVEIYSEGGGCCSYYVHLRCIKLLH